MPDRQWSLQQRLRRQLLAWIGALWLLGAAAALGGLWYESSEVLDGALEETAQLLMAMPEASLTPLVEPPPSFDPQEEYIAYQIFDANGVMRTRSHAAPTQPLDATARDGVLRSGDWQVLTLTAADGSRRVQVAETIEHRFEVLWTSAVWLLVALLVVLPVAAWGIRLLLTRGFATLEPSRIELAGRQAHDLRPLQTDQLPQELHPWLQTVNALMGRVQSLVDAERAFAAHTAHELRTPLAAARAQAQRLAQSAGLPAERTQALALVRQLDRITHLATRLLQLARIESGVALKRESVELVELATMVADEFAEARRAGRLLLQVEADPVHVEGDLDALGIALRNLVDNALKHGGGAGPVTIRIAPHALAVIDQGPGVAQASLEQLGQKFERGQSSADGAGLGLAMARTIARQSDAQLVLRSPVEHGHGFSASIEFAVPKADAK
jgi:two-component system OmpR family sensor kinase